ncbi:CRISPR system precrRNA processing endoribonuclease RAMP protein Cas6 [Halomonas campisalis]|uniref:CRISPR system precrRNA processing endoribonuclease RAMP protein Cas6 n=1 Tax=Billgrantia campisalis TaxID=74661 RepID=A0ABS9PC91_9GAMM|nr:CRISPR system precrRNA processing endoribonuclease RAMP protein Cas6 [Halomonas campisalis]MCG6659393.1 CRISPR system precrRNA processing endoribonuclease RAMP protein Cas6 [Halomonas campisalis]MDR5863995.1 CRISPR system precrRNA processing endoribonuclease RAMP protein Cas6 [Halomonas campisalis]
MNDLPLCRPGDTLPLARYRFTLQAEAPLHLPAYPGSMLRGSLGHGLRSVSCITRQNTCEGCPLLEACQYPALFQPRPSTELAARFPEVPAPYVIEVPLGTPTTLAPGERFHFEMVLFGPAQAQLGTLILAWQRAAWHGLGKGRARATLTAVEWERTPDDWLTVFTPDTGSVTPHRARLALPEIPAETSTVTLQLDTPTRLQYHGKLCNSWQLTASIVLRTLERKVALYAHCYLGALPAAPKDASLESIRLDASTRLYQWQRYSSRQQQRMAMDGLVGTLTLHGQLAHWLPWLWLGQYTHLGKNTSFGLGRYRLHQS